jgi:hypothetical protein
MQDGAEGQRDPEAAARFSARGLLGDGGTPDGRLRVVCDPPRRSPVRPDDPEPRRDQDSGGIAPTGPNGTSVPEGDTAIPHAPRASRGADVGSLRSPTLYLIPAFARASGAAHGAEDQGSFMIRFWSAYRSFCNTIFAGL